jgi:hypothetical protein
MFLLTPFILCKINRNCSPVIPAKAGIHPAGGLVIPAKAGIHPAGGLVIPAKAGMTGWQIHLTIK